MTSSLWTLSTLRSAFAGLALLSFAAPALSADLTQAQIDLGKQLVVANGAAKTFDNIFASLLTQTQRSATQTRPELTKQVEESLNALRPEFEARKDEMVTIAGKIFATDLTEQEMKDSLAFFNTPTGKKYVTAQPTMLNKLVAVTQAWQKVVSTDMIERLRAELKKKNVDF